MMAPMPETPDSPAADIFTDMLRVQGEAARQMLGTFLPEAADAVPDEAALAGWGEAEAVRRREREELIGLVHVFGRTGERLREHELARDLVVHPLRRLVPGGEGIRARDHRF